LGRVVVVASFAASVGAAVALGACNDGEREDPIGAMAGQGITSGSGMKVSDDDGGGGQGGAGGAGGAPVGAGGEGGQSSCDDSGFCDICAQCAVVSDCATEQVECNDDTNCSQAMLCLQECNVSCMAEPACYQICKDQCEMDQPGFADAVDTLACWCADACMNDCSAYTTTDCLSFAP
jgi:hypothetical protein